VRTAAQVVRVVSDAQRVLGRDDCATLRIEAGGVGVGGK
jgi:hypothetical protein